MIEFFASPDSLHDILQEATRHPGKTVIIHLTPGIYQGTYEVHQDHLTLLGENPETTIMTGSLYAKQDMNDEEGLTRGTFRTQTLFVDADFFTAKNITFANTSGPGELVGQAVAVYSDGDYITYENCKFLGHQDTLFAAPLPLQVREHRGFRGPKEFLPRKQGRQLYRHCYIEGTVDFIFGGGLCYFEDCEIYSLSRPNDGIGYVTAPSTPEEQPYGFVFYHCKFTGNAKEKSVYLGRPWRNHARVAIIQCFLGAHIHQAHWSRWNDKEDHSTVVFSEYDNFGPGAEYVEELPYFAYTIEENELANYLQDHVFASLSK